MRPSTPGTLNSSAGFKTGKRPVLGKLRKDEETKDIRELPRILEGSEATNPSFFKSYILDLQNAVNNEDIDRRIRAGDLGLSQGPILALKKWLRDTWDAPQDRDDSIARIFRALQAQNFEEAFGKMYRIVCNTDALLSKATELAVVYLLKYDEALAPIYEQTGVKFTNLFASGVTLTRFNAFLAIFQRYQLLAERALKSRRLGQKTQRVQPLKSQSSKPSESRQQIELMARLQGSEQSMKRLRDQKQQLQQQLSKLREQSRSRNLDLGVIPPNIVKMVPKEVLEQTGKVLRNTFQASTASLVSQVEDLRTENNLLKAELQAFRAEHMNLYQPPPLEQSLRNSYQECLQNELQLMRSSYERKLSAVTGHKEGTNRQLARKEAQTRKQMMQLKQEKDMLMRKWQLLKS